MSDNQPTGAPVWYRELGSTDVGLRLAEAWTSDEHADGSYTRDEPRRAALVWRTTASEHGLLHVNVPPERAPDAPALWYVASDEPRGRPPSCALVAYLDAGVPPGTVMSPLQFATLDVHPDSLAGTVRWLHTGLVVELYVPREHRLQNIGLSLVHAAGAWHQANRWPDFIYAEAAAAAPDALAPVMRRHPTRVRGWDGPPPPDADAPPRRRGPFRRR